MEFEWDEAKNQLNIAKHGVSFDKAQKVFDGDTLTRVDERYHYDEIREVSIGVVEGVLYLTVVHTDTKTGNIRLISARRANKRERERYEKTLR